MSRHEISFNTRQPEAIRTKADFIYHMGPDWITIADTGKGKCSVAEDLESVLREDPSTGTRARSQSSRSSVGTAKDFGIKFSGMVRPRRFSLGLS